MQRVWAGVLAGMTTLAFACAPAGASKTSVHPTAGVEPGVTIEEGSPAAKEYALALTQARHTGSTGSHSSSAEAPFGAGIKPPASPGSGAAGSARGASAPRSHTDPRTKGAASSVAGAGAGSSPSLPAAVLRAERSTSSSDGSLLALLGGGVAILVLGALGGVILRHNRRPPSHA